MPETLNEDQGRGEPLHEEDDWPDQIHVQTVEISKNGDDLRLVRFLLWDGREVGW